MFRVFWFFGVSGFRNFYGRKRRLKIIRKGRVRREELGNGGRRVYWSGEIVMYFLLFRYERTCIDIYYCIKVLYR